MATTTFTFYTVAWQGQDGISAPGLNTPLPDSKDGAVGTSTSFAREDHKHPYDFEVIGVGTDQGDKIWPLSPVSQVVRAFARREGDLVFFSFVAQINSATSPNTALFETDGSLAPPASATIDFVMVDSNENGKFGKIETVYSGLTPSGTIKNGEIYSISGLPSGTIRGEVVWSLH